MSFNVPRRIWKSRRPIGKLFLCDNSGASSTLTNPAGWLNQGALDVVGDHAAFAAAFDYYKGNVLTILANIHAQGIIVWDIEGARAGVPHYLGEPKQTLLLNPELNVGASGPHLRTGGVLNDFFKTFRDAGYKVGVTIRPHDYNFDTAAWVESANPMRTLHRKARFAYEQWGCRIFYIDTNLILPDSGPVLPAIVFDELHKLLPDCLLIPEHEDASYYNSTFPYTGVADGYLPTPSYLRKYYPDASRAVDADGATAEQVAALGRTEEGRDLILCNAWYHSVTQDYIVGDIAEGGTDGF